MFFKFDQKILSAGYLFLATHNYSETQSQSMFLGGSIMIQISVVLENIIKNSK